MRQTFLQEGFLMAGQILIMPEQAKVWCRNFLSAKCKQTREDAQTAADVLVSANLRGVESHGIGMMVTYANRFSRIETRKRTILAETPTGALIDGGDNMGMPTAVFSMKKAIELAKKSGVGLVSVRNSNHFGAAAYYALMAPKEDMIGIAMTNAGKRLSPWGGLDCILGNNPFAIAVPSNKFPVALDMANSIVAFQKIALYAREGLRLPDGWAMDAKGEPTDDAQAALSGLLMPVGGYKGVGLAVIVDILCGILSQNGLSESVADNNDYDHARKIGHFFITIRISDFVDPGKFRDDIDAFIGRFHNVRRKAGVDKLYMPGEIEYCREQERVKNGFPLSSAAVEQLNKLSDDFGVARLC
jgi:LDH2 family malate/lactate/ureidoglycolate dehydrogenase